MYQLFAPARPLQPFITSYWVFRARDAQLQENVFVDGQADLLFNFGCAYTRRYLNASDKSDLLGFSNLDAQRNYPVGIVQQGDIDLIAVRFRPGGLAAFLPLPSRELSNQALDVHAVFGAASRELENRLYDAAGDRAAKIRLLNTFFLRRLRLDTPYEFALYIARQIEAADGKIAIQELSSQVGYSIRTVDRLFRGWFGLSPKFYARIARFQRALKLLTRDPNISLMDVTLSCGYYDQSHLTKEFSDFTGQTPEQHRLHLLAKAAAPPPNLVQFLQEA